MTLDFEVVGSVVLDNGDRLVALKDYTFPFLPRGGLVLTFGDLRSHVLDEDVVATGDGNGAFIEWDAESNCGRIEIEFNTDDLGNWSLEDWISELTGLGWTIDDASRPYSKDADVYA